MSKQRITTRYMAVVAMFTAISFIAVLIGRIIPNVAGFLSYDPKDAVIAIAGFLLGPMASVFITVIVSFIEMITISSTGPYGMIMNIVSTCAFTVPAAVFPYFTGCFSRYLKKCSIWAMSFSRARARLAVFRCRQAISNAPGSCGFMPSG